MRKTILATLLMLMSVTAYSQNPLYRYVKTDGAFANDGMSWTNAKSNIQDAINSLHDYMQEHGITKGGCVFVAQGTYKPTESTETSGGSLQNMSFKMYSGISVSGCWEGDENETLLESGDRYKNYLNSDGSVAETTRAMRNQTWHYAHPTILSGNLSSAATFKWNRDRQIYNTTFPSNVYHVVWFATNGFDANGRANALDEESVLDGVVIEGGHAFNDDLAALHPHNAYGAGVYAVQGARLLNVEVRYCEASRDGAGIYFDGGGVANHAYVHHCQALGLGIMYGRGGGACVDGAGVIDQSFFMNNVAREGAGVALQYNAGRGLYDAICESALIANNTATSEAGGVYLYGGGVLNNVSVVRNRCNGIGTTVNDVVSGQSAGVFAYGPGRVYNSLLWGGQIGDNGNVAAYNSSSKMDMYDDIQFASYVGSGMKTPAVFYVAMNNYDRVNWTRCSIEGGISLALGNRYGDVAGEEVTAKYPNLVSVAPTAGIRDITEDMIAKFLYEPNFTSALANAGVQLIDITSDGFSYTLTNVHHVKDIVDVDFSPRCDIGAYAKISERSVISHTSAISAINGEAGKTMTIFVDPKRNTGEILDQTGVSWDKPMNNLRDALAYIQKYRIDNPGHDFVNFQILCKEGDLYSYSNSGRDRLPGTSIPMLSGVKVYGGYYEKLTGTNLEQSFGGSALVKRNPVTYPTIINGYVAGTNYNHNTCHLVTFGNVHDAVLDGFQLRYGNATGIAAMKLEGINVSDKGGGVFFTNSCYYDPDGFWRPWVGAKVHMTGNVVRNCYIVNCQAKQGAAVWADCEGVDVSSDDVHLSLENVIIHNNGVIHGKGDIAQVGNGVVHVTGGAKLYFNHCDLLRNVGNAIVNDGGSVEVNNTLFYANARSEMQNTNLITPDNVMEPIVGAATGNYNQLDYLATNLPSGDGNRAFLQYDLKAHYGGTTDYSYPRFKNPTSSAGISETGDVTYYGTATSWEPNSMSPMVNSADPHEPIGNDITTLTPRTYGNLADVGAVECTDHPEEGAGLYVRDYGTTDHETTDPDGTRRDGLSWKYAINGNADYGTTEETTLGYTMHGGGYYLSKSGSNIRRATSDANALYFRIDNLVDGATTTLYAPDMGKYISYSLSNKKVPSYSLANTGANFILRKQGTNTYYIQVANTTYYLRVPTSNTANPSFVNGTGTATLWTLGEVKEATSTHVKGLQYAIDIANGIFGVSGEKQEVWVAAGTYYGNVEMKEGADVLGGFPNFGHPCKADRNISNIVAEYKTIIDAQNSGRVCHQAANFTTETIWEGLILQHGNLGSIESGGAGANLMAKSVLKNCLIQNNTYQTPGGAANGGAGVRLNGSAKVESCIIKRNTINNTTSDFAVAAGVYIAGSNNLFINSLVVENVSNSTNRNTLGAALYSSGSGNFYNCTFAYNTTSANGYAQTGGVWDNNKSSHFYNCIFWGNVAKGNTVENFYQVGQPGFSQQDGNASGRLHNCYESTFNKATSSYNQDSKTVDELRDVLYCSNPSASASYNQYDAFVNNCHANSIFVGDDAGFVFGTTELTYELKPEAQYCINMGTDSQLESMGVTEDIAGNARIQDCRSDKGAFEYNAAANIAEPTLENGEYCYYLTQNGEGVRNAGSKANAGCVTKLQQVLDEAGRYYYQHSDRKVVVKLAGEGDFSYVPTRSTDPFQPDLERMLGIMVPRGIEVRGGYDNAFSAEPTDFTTNKTTLESIFHLPLQPLPVHGYHTVTFTDVLYDRNGQPLLKTQGVNDTSTFDPNVSHSTDKPFLTIPNGRTVLNGLYITGGQATSDESSVVKRKNYECYGGAAIVPAYGQIRNCVLYDNVAQAGGGALLLQPGAIVSGTIIKNNTARMGGGIYFEELADDEEPTIDGMAHVISTTIVNNTATSRGGGIYFKDNARVNSSVVWGNHSGDQPNVSGNVNAEIIDYNYATVEMYPFAYTAVENNRMPGVNNISVGGGNDEGARFDDTSDNSLYGLTEFSTLRRHGMPVADYSAYAARLGMTDIKGVTRDDTGTDKIDMGARAYVGTEPIVTMDNLLLRLYVSDPKFCSTATMQNLKNSSDILYNQEGSSFGYPFQNLDDALLYIYKVRKDAGLKNYTSNLPFEVIVSEGTFYPSHSVIEQAEKAYCNSFLIPEGVVVSGGYRPDDVYTSASNTFFGQGNRPNAKTNASYTANPSSTLSVDAYLASNQTAIGEASKTVAGYTILQQALSAMQAPRPHADNNANNIIEPWEYKYQTVLSGDIVNGDVGDKSYHVVSALADESLVGKLPKSIVNANYLDYTTTHETGATVELNGLQVSDGQARIYEESVNEKFMVYDYYHGGGLIVDGNWFDGVYKHEGHSNTVGYRDIPVVLDRCLFLRNDGGFGGAVSSNGTVNVFNCDFAGNIAMGGEDTGVTALSGTVPTIQYPGNGGAIYVTKQLNAVNTLFENNEANPNGMGTEQRTFSSPRRGSGSSTAQYPGAGGAIYAGKYAHVGLVNCDVVRNKANVYPALQTANPNSVSRAIDEDYNRVFNTVFWGNEGTNTLHPDLAKHSINAIGNAQSLWFCAFEEDCYNTGDAPVYSADKRTAAYDVAQHPSTLLDGVNNNVIISSDNNAIDGTNFRHPSYQTGAAGYMQASDWSVARVNQLTDAGWGYIRQTISDADGDNTGVKFENDDLADAAKCGGVFLETYKQFSGRVRMFGHYNQGTDAQIYMIVSSDGTPILRISKTPIPVEGTMSYIDIGVHEYQHRRLGSVTGDVDELWVSAKEKPENGVADGSSWDKPTSDLQRAIETLLLHRNGHDKKIYLIEGEYKPTYTFDGNVCFLIDGGRLQEQVIEPAEGGTADHFVNSLTIEGGYSFSIENERQIEEYPSIVSTENPGSQSLFQIHDARRWYGKGGLATVDKTGVVQLMPITIDGITMRNEYGKGLVYEAQDAGVNQVGNALNIVRCHFEDCKETAVELAEAKARPNIFNSLFNDNLAAPFTALSTKVAHCTFANNGASATLDANSSLYGSILWNPSADNLGVEPATKAENAAYPGFTGAITLSAVNNDLSSGPNFVDPNNKNYNLQPSRIILNKIEPATYEGWTGTAAASDTDLAGLARLVNDKVDRGAYECQQILKSVIYYDPNRTVSGDGSSWANAYGRGHLQSALDMVAMSASESAPGYVFAKGGRNGLETDESIVARDGVYLYGSIPTSYLVDAADEYPATLAAYANALRQTRPGLAGPSTDRTIVDGFIADDIFTLPTVTDGVEVDGALSMNDRNSGSNVVLRNAIVHTDANSAVSSALLYNVLVRDSKITLSNGATIVNVTSNTTVTGGTQLNSRLSAEKSLDFGDENIAYQLTEDNPDGSVGGGTDVIPAKWSAYINYDADRDVLGNPRLLSAAVDKGAFEWWHIADVVTADYNESNNVWRNFPHEGSYICIENDANLLLDPSIKTNGHSFTPAFLHLHEGASVYGQGNSVKVPHIRMDKYVHGDGEVVAMPFRTTYSGTGAIVYAYDGSERASGDHTFTDSNSDCWKLLNGAGDIVIEPTQAVLYQPTSGISGLTQFEGNGTNLTDYVYLEDGSDKTVTLTQYNTDGKTKLEDMGWNGFGAPFLVANYYTKDKVSRARTLWEYYYENKSDETGEYREVNSWDAGTCIILGEGVFTQTATFDATEDLTFPLPVYVPLAPVRRHVWNLDTPSTEMEQSLSPVEIAVVGRQMMVTGLNDGDAVRVYDASGRLLLSDVAVSERYSKLLPSSGLYIIRAAGKAGKFNVR